MPSSTRALVASRPSTFLQAGGKHIRTSLGGYAVASPDPPLDVPRAAMQAGQFVIDELVAMVQTPQSFTNVSEDDPLGQQYRYFYGPVLRGWDAVGSTPCCGTNVTFNRKALTSVGGFTYGSITEDFLTSMTLHSHGSVLLH
eukprot:50292-Eustigmatos_ZCMA.PRE.1